MRTPEEIKEEIRKLEVAMKFVPEYNMFGDDNHERIRAAIKVLRGKATPRDYWDAPVSLSLDLISEAEQAYDWMQGKEGVGADSEEWEGLVTYNGGSYDDDTE